jgi:TM2 domain-containing membrane protein YozV
MSPAARAFLEQERSNRTERLSEGAIATAFDSAGRYGQPIPKSDRSLLIAYVLWWFAAPLAAHRFYLGAYKSALIMLGLFWGGLFLAMLMSKKSTIALGGVFLPPPGIAMILICIVWWLVDLFLIPGVRRRHSGSERENLSTVFA